jgi:hypothetical protein
LAERGDDVEGDGGAVMINERRVVKIPAAADLVRLALT